MNLANKITIIRILLIPIFIFFMFANIKGSNYYAVSIFLIAAATDSLDGYLARKKNQVTNLGKFLDPIADKLLVISALVCLVELNRVSSIIVIIIISREIIITGFRVICASEGTVLAASWWGKIKTVSQIIAIVLLLLNNYPFSELGIPASSIFVYFATIITVYSGYDYIQKNIDVFKQSKNV